MKQTHIAVEGAGMAEIQIVDSDHKISWKRSGQGRCEVVAKTHISGAKWLSLMVEETPYAPNAKTRATFATLERPAALALRNLLNKAFGGPVAWIDKDGERELSALVYLRDELATHIDSFRKGLEVAKRACELTHNAEDAAYWEHEIKALSDIEIALAATREQN